MKLSRILLLILILSGFSAPRCSAKVYDSDGSEGSVESCIRSAADGDIVTLPAGTFSWTSRLEITKGITLKGQTTIAGAGTSNPTITDATIIQVNTPSKGANTGIIKATMTPAQSFRLTGITFVKGSSTVVSPAKGGAHHGDRGTADKLGEEARQQPSGGAGNRPTGAGSPSGQGITGGNRPSGGSGNPGGANRPGGGAGARNFGGTTRPGGGAGARPGGGGSFGGGDGLIQFMSAGAAPNRSMRMDHCHVTAPIYYGALLRVNGWIYGVADHNVLEVTGNSRPFFVAHKSWGNQDNGNGSWSDYPWFGTEKFFFIEDNTLTRTGRAPGGVCDSFEGGRWVIRHNYLLNVVPNGHGTEAAAVRGQRANEFYDNTISLQIAPGGGTQGSGGTQRSGTSLWHDNSFIGLEPKDGKACHLKNYRQTSAYPHPIWGIADGTSPWDVNDTEGNGTYVEGHPPFLFASGSATSETSFSGEQATFSDSTKNWTPNQWAGYSIKATNKNSICYGLGSYIVSNTSNTITYAHYTGTDVKFHLIFNNGDAYEIHRVLIQLDQNGRGKGDLITGWPRPTNTTKGKASWNHAALEPCYSWNNVYTPNGHALGFGAGRAQPTTKLDVDFFNLGSGFPVDSTPSQVSSRYKAALNGVDYTGTFVYPHPLVSGSPPAAQYDTKFEQPAGEKKEANKKGREQKS